MVRNEIKDYLASVSYTAAFKRRLKTVLPVLSLLVIISVFWWLKLTGITMAGEAFCGIEEHVHGEECMTRTLICTEEVADESVMGSEESLLVEEEPPAEPGKPAEPEAPAERETPGEPEAPAVHVHTDACYEISYVCGLQEHIHEAACYSNASMDVETSADWEATLPELIPQAYRENIVNIAVSQLGYQESEMNFVLDDEGERRGYSRYGEWYGSPYGAWSTMFTSFCLRYGEVTDLPLASGADAFRIQWEEGQRYLPADTYTPIPGDVIFLDKNGNGTPECTGIVINVTEQSVEVIEGDCENQVAETEYLLTDSVITGYGLTVMDGMMMLEAEEGTVIGTITAYNASATAGGSFILYTQGSDGAYYAIDGNANAVKISIDEMGRISAAVDNTDLLFWTFASASSYDGQTAYYIQNVSTGKYLHPYTNSNTDRGAVLVDRWESAAYPNGSGIRIRGARQNAYALLSNNESFTIAGNLNGASTFYFGRPLEKTTIWLDGTCGNVRSMNGSLNRSYQVEKGGTFTLPTEWQSPSKYSYKIQGWFDLKNNRYYLPGEEITVIEPLVFYPDWVAETYDIGRFNERTANTVSTDAHITTHVFDYNFLFNLHSANVSVTADGSGHSESWNLVQRGNVNFQGAETLDFVMTDNEGPGRISKPRNLNNDNQYTGNSGGPFPNLYNETIAEALFATDNAYDPSTGTGILGKQYLGTGDHLFQFGTDPDSEYYGYYYFDSNLNGVSYSQRDQRFYVYEYLQRTTDSGSNKTGDFLPLNSPYANTNGCPVEEYRHNGSNNEYVGTTHYQYDIFRSNDYAAANLWFGMSMDTRFYLPDDPGTRGSDGQYGNKDVYGNDMHFRFSGDDDVWVLVDGQVVLDLGGIHRSLSGDINFSTGKVTVNGTESNLSNAITAGEHTLTIYYLERGGGQSNCQIRFNLAPRYSLTLQKEDVLTQEVLNGAQFSVYTDKSCTEEYKAKLWTSEESYNNNDPATNVFTVVDGKTTMWGLGAGKTYYIKESKPPDDAEYRDNLVKGIICLTLDKSGNASYRVEIAPESDKVTSPGFTVHGYRIDEESQQAYIVATNAPEWVQETTSIQAYKVWDDKEDHSGDAVTVYLTVRDPDGTVRRIREVQLSEANDWTYIWANMPKYWEDGTTPVEYGVEEAYISGYTPTIIKVDKITGTSSYWAEVGSFETGKTYILGTSSGFLSADSASSDKLKFVVENAARTSELALWKATVNSSGKVKFTNGKGQILTYNNENSSSNGYFYLTTGSSGSQNLTINDDNGIRFYCTQKKENYYICALNNENYLSASTSEKDAVTFTPKTLVEVNTETYLKGYGFKITNTPLEDETSLTVHKEWNTGQATNADYERLQVTVKLLADGIDTGRTLTLSLKNSWTGIFLGLPYTHEDGSIIKYTVEEKQISDKWMPTYGEIITSDSGGGKDSNPIYETTITNTYVNGGPMLPSTGGLGPIPWILCGFFLMAGSLVYGYMWRRKRERRYRKE